MKYPEIDTKVKTGEKTYNDLLSRKDEATARIADTKKDVSKAEDDLQAALVKDDKKQADILHAKIEKMEREIIHRDTMLIEGIKKELSALEGELEELKKKRDRIFADNAVKVLETEKATHSRIAKELIASTRRLLCLHNLLRHRGHGEVYPKIIGAAYDVLPGLRIPVLDDFDRAQFANSRALHYGQNVIAELEKKIYG